MKHPHQQHIQETLAIELSSNQKSHFSMKTPVMKAQPHDIHGISRKGQALQMSIYHQRTLCFLPIIHNSISRLFWKYKHCFRSSKHSGDLQEMLTHLLVTTKAVNSFPGVVLFRTGKDRVASAIVCCPSNLVVLKHSITHCCISSNTLALRSLRTSCSINKTLH